MNKFYLTFATVGAATYIFWGYIIESVMSEIVMDSLSHRAIVVGPIFLLLLSQIIFKKINPEYLTYLGILVITADYCYLISLNKNSLVYTTGSYVILTASLSVIIKRWFLWCYAFSFFLFCLFHILLAKDIITQTHWANMITLVALMTFFGLWRIKYLNQLNYEYATNLEKSKQLEELNFISAQAAHDIRSPVMALSALASSLENTDLKKKKIITDSINRVSEIADSLVIEFRKRFSTQLSSDESKTIFDQQPVSEFIENLVNEKLVYKSKFRQYNIQIHGKIDFKIQDPSTQLNIKRAVSNLINNSIEAFTQDHGKIDIILNENKDSFFIGVKDNGIGIPNHLHEKIFEKGTTFNKQNGTGLGLAHAKETIERLGGSIELSSKDGFGTLIQLAIPKT